MVLAYLLTAATSEATPQKPDVLDYKGTNYNIGVWFDGLPLENYFKAGHSRPTCFRGVRSGCWRGYVACWRVANERLWLTEVFVCTNGIAEKYGLEEIALYRYPLTQIFGTNAPAIEASWFTGTIELERRIVERQKAATGEEQKREGAVLVFENGKLLREEKRYLKVLVLPDESLTNGLPIRSRVVPPPLEPESK